MFYNPLQCFFREKKPWKMWQLFSSGKCILSGLLISKELCATDKEFIVICDIWWLIQTAVPPSWAANLLPKSLYSVHKWDLYGHLRVGSDWNISHPVQPGYDPGRQWPLVTLTHVCILWNKHLSSLHNWILAHWSDEFTAEGPSAFFIRSDAETPWEKSPPRYFQIWQIILAREEIHFNI